MFTKSHRSRSFPYRPTRQVRHTAYGSMSCPIGISIFFGHAPRTKRPMMPMLPEITSIMPSMLAEFHPSCTFPYLRTFGPYLPSPYLRTLGTAVPPYLRTSVPPYLRTKNFQPYLDSEKYAACERVPLCFHLVILLN